MTLTDFFWGLADLLTSTFTVLQENMVGEKFNYAVIALGFFGLFYWLRTQKKLSDKAEREGTLK